MIEEYSDSYGELEHNNDNCDGNEEECGGPTVEKYQDAVMEDSNRRSRVEERSKHTNNLSWIYGHRLI